MAMPSLYNALPYVISCLVSTVALMGCGVASNTVGKTNTANQPNDTDIASSLAPNQTASLDKALANCGSQFYQTTQPAITVKLKQDTYPLCFNGFAVLYSGVSKTPVWVAEYLTRQRLAYAKNLVREDNFHEETRLPVAARSVLNDYNNSGYDRGHLAPNADMSSKSAQSDSFSLANIAPQHPSNNRKTWVKIESQTRDITNQYGAAYVVSGVAYLSADIKILKNRVLVPSHFYKAIYVPSQNKAVAFISPNDASGRVDTLTLAQLQKRTGVDAFPNVATAVKSTLLPLK